MKKRRRARGIALKVLYELDCTRHAMGEILAARVADEPIDAALIKFAADLINGVIAYRVPVDKIIQRHAPEWPFSQMAIIDRNILRIAIYEFAIEQTTPTKVAINEAVELAKLYGSDAAPRFVNGVLGTLASHENDIRQSLASHSQS